MWLNYFNDIHECIYGDVLCDVFIGLVDPEARGQSLVALFHSLPSVNFKTAVYLFKHLRKYDSLSIHCLLFTICFVHSVASMVEFNKMTLNNLATVFGPNLFRQGYSDDKPASMAAAFDIMSPVNILMFFLTCPEEVFEEMAPGSTPSSYSKASSKKMGIDEDSSSISSSQSSGFVSSMTGATPSSPVAVLPSSPTTFSSPTSSSASHVQTTPSTTPTSGPFKFKQSEI